MRGGFVLASEAWAGSRIGAAVDGLFGAAFVVGDREWVLDGDARWWVWSIVGPIGSAVYFLVTVAGWWSCARSLAGLRFF